MKFLCKLTVSLPSQSHSRFCSPDIYSRIFWLFLLRFFLHILKCYAYSVISRFNDIRYYLLAFCYHRWGFMCCTCLPNHFTLPQIIKMFYPTHNLINNQMFTFFMIMYLILITSASSVGNITFPSLDFTNFLIIIFSTIFSVYSTSPPKSHTFT